MAIERIIKRIVREGQFNAAFQHIKKYFESKHDIGLVGAIHSWLPADYTGVLVTYTEWECYTQVLAPELQKFCEEYHLAFEVLRYRKKPASKQGRAWSVLITEDMGTPQGEEVKIRITLRLC